MAIEQHPAWYSVDDDEDRFKALTVQIYIEEGKLMCGLLAARWCAEDYHDNHDGWESFWPLEITVYATEDGPAVGTYVVDREHKVSFTAREKA